ncbi:MAG: galactokinase family protein [Eubacteriales bacterium]
MSINEKINNGTLDPMLLTLYGKENLEFSRNRSLSVLTGFEEAYGNEATSLFSAPGRTEIGGNHTDHQQGCVLAAAVNLDLLAAVSTCTNGKITVHSQGYPVMEVELSQLEPQKSEENTSLALIRGVAARFVQLGCDLSGKGLNIWMCSDVPGGSGLSSSAAFEVLLGTIINALFWESKCSPVEIAQIGQYAENVFFGKPCGLMDQTASSVGGIISIDFQEKESPVVQQIPFDFAQAKHALCILDSGADHADLTEEYASITQELADVCTFFGKKVLREVPKEKFLQKLPQLREKVSQRGILRAFHVYSDNQRVSEQVEALAKGDFSSFLRLVEASGNSSGQFLQNVVPTGQVNHQELMLAIALCKEILQGRGAVRVHGGGFGGTAMAFVPLDCLQEFKTKAEALLGEGACHVLSIRPLGGVQLT